MLLAAAERAVFNFFSFFLLLLPHLGVSASFFCVATEARREREKWRAD